MSTTATDLHPPASNEEGKKVLEEMTLAELGIEIPCVVILSRSILFWKGSTKINEKVTIEGQVKFTTTPLHSALSTLIVYATRMERRHTISQDYGTAYNDVFEFALKLIKTARRTDKIGCNLNETTDKHDSPLQRVLELSTQHPVRTKAVVLMETLIAEGAKINTYELGYVKERLKDHPFDLKVHVAFDLSISSSVYEIVQSLLTPLDKILLAPGILWDSSADTRFDCYSLSRVTWDPSQDIPSKLKTPALKVLLKSIYQQRVFVSDCPDMTPEQLNALIKTQINNAFPTGVNGIIISYICPEILDLQTLSCFKRSPLFYQNVLNMGRHLCEEDRKKELEQLAFQQSQVFQQGQAAQPGPASQNAANGAENLSLSLMPLYSTSLQRAAAEVSMEEQDARKGKQQAKSASIRI